MNNDNLIEYYTQEFNMLKDAHFQTSQKIISFFQYALLIFSAPIALITSEQISRPVLGMVFFVIGIIETLVIAYLSSLRSEALLYARQINRIRSILYTDGILGEHSEKIHERKILFSQDKKPRFIDNNQFLFIVLVLALFSAFYVAFGSYKLITYYKVFSNFKYILNSTIFIAITMFLLSCLIHFIISRYNENGTLYYKPIIGVDIDGVLNYHENVFVDILKKETGKEIQVEDITELPVHLTNRVTLEEEHKVFKAKEYWINQSLMDYSKECLTDELRNKFGIKTYIFTWRDWSVCRDLNNPKDRFNIKQYTKSWLKQTKISYSKLRFEKGNYDRPISIFSSKYKTRFYYASKYKIRYFVEDDLRNAKKLSHICEYVFLINHPYNQCDSLPYNIIRVNDWHDILKWIKIFY